MAWMPNADDEFVCPDCGAPTEQADWWDDAPENGGAAIGYRLRCTKCDWEESY
jgi:hypothetical protein